MTPVHEALVARQDHRGLLVAPRHQTEQQAGVLPRERQVADLVRTISTLGYVAATGAPHFPGLARLACSSKGQRTRWPTWAALMASPMARSFCQRPAVWSSTTFSASSTKPSAHRAPCGDRRRKLKSNCQGLEPRQTGLGQACLRTFLRGPATHRSGPGSTTPGIPEAGRHTAPPDGRLQGLEEAQGHLLVGVQRASLDDRQPSASASTSRCRAIQRSPAYDPSHRRDSADRHHLAAVGRRHRVARARGVASHPTPGLDELVHRHRSRGAHEGRSLALG